LSVAPVRERRVTRWLYAILPVVLIAALIALFLVRNPIPALRAVPPVEAVAFERTVFEPGSVEVHVRNDGPNRVSIAQVLVNNAYRDFSITDASLGRLETATVRIPYPWDEGLPLTVGLVTSTGLVLEHDVEAAALTPQPSASTLGIYALLGIYIGVVPIAVGLMWFPSLRRAPKRWLTFFLAGTVGLLAFLLLDTVAEGLELAAETAAALNGLSLFALGAVIAVVVLLLFEGALGRSRSAIAGLGLAYLVAAGIGLHNLGEGLAVGAALAAGEAALGTFLIVGFALHNTTEGLAIVAPLGSSGDRPSLWHFIGLGAVAGAPTIVGAWAGGFTFSPAWASLAFGLAAGALAQVVWQIAKGMGGARELARGWGAAGFLVGFAVMYATGLVAA
jgi:zinc transporter, ZIP family